MASPFAPNPTTGDRVKETTISTSTLSVGATINLAGAVASYQSFVNGIGNGTSCFYCVLSGNNWQVCRGTVTSGSPNTLSVDAFLSSSSGSPITLSGTSTVFQTAPAHGTDFYSGGAWSGTTSYVKGAVVTYGGVYYLARENVPATNLAASPTVDGHTHNSANASSLTLTLTTTATDDIIYVGLAGSIGANITGVSSTNTTGWALRKRETNGADWCEVWAGSATTALTSEAITVTLSGGDYPAGVAFGVNGAASFASPFDANAAIPGGNNGASSTDPAISGVSTNSAYDLLLGFIGVGGNSAGSLPPAFTAIDNTATINPGNIIAGYISPAATETASSWTTSAGAVSGWGFVVDAVTAGAGPPGVDPRWIATGGVNNAVLTQAFGNTVSTVLGVNSGGNWVAAAASSFAGNSLFAGVMAAAPTKAGTGLTSMLGPSSPTAADVAGIGIVVTVPGTGGMAYGAVPSTPYSFTALLSGMANYGPLFGWTNGTKLQFAYAPRIGDTSAGAIVVITMSSFGTWVATQATVTVGAHGDMVWMKIRDDGTNIYFYFSADGYNWGTAIYSVAKTSGYLGSAGYTYWGFGCVNPGRASLLSLVKGTS